jgi:hypothetical protein
MDNLEVGSIVTYRLLPRHLPRDPSRLWLGEITKVTPELICVTSLEPGYEGQEEDILVEQVISVQNQERYPIWGNLHEYIAFFKV